MADQGRWWKLWCSALDDDDLDNLPIADFGRYCKLGAHIKEHGNSGTITLKPPAKTLLSTLQLVTFDEIIALVKTFPNVSHTTTSHPSVTLTVTYHNWKKFQEDTSAERTREWRKRKKISASHPETTIEEKRREEKRVLPPQPPLRGVTPLEDKDPRVKTLIDFYHEQFGLKFGASPPINGKKDGAIVKKLLSGRSLDEAQWLIREHLTNPSDFFESKNLYGLQDVLRNATTLLARRAKARNGD